MKDAQPRTIYLKDYRVPDFLIEKTELDFKLEENGTEVRSRLTVRRNPVADSNNASLVLHGQELTLVALAIDGKGLDDSHYQLTSDTLTIDSVPDQFVLSCTTHIKPQENTSLEGLYRSRTMYCTQCEAEGFRKITYYLDRPDVMSEFTTRIEADKTRYPVLLSNGNLVDQGSSENNRHWVKWHDPYKKPAYLFALVAGDLSYIEDHYQTGSGRDVVLRIFVEPKDLDKCDHAMLSLKNAMQWDEKVYGREYDLDIYMIVAVDDFNMGAMENKGLNIFNTSCVLAKPETTTDAGFQRVEGVVAHEYFHNWSGNRVTCRDWFQLSLKEGFTVFRDAEFSADMGSRTVKRVEDVSLLRTAQFAEDGGPMAHPVQPPSYIEISNFYTLTIYEKGAEVVRMIHSLLGAETFRKGSDLYFERHDGQAVTIQDFVKAMEEVSGRDLSQFKLWYGQAGTPRLLVSASYDADAETFSLTIRQSCPPTPESSVKEPFHMPIAMGLVGEAGSLPLYLAGEDADTETSDNTHRVLELTQPEQTFVFERVKEAPVPSLLRGFSAPVKLDYDYNRDDLMRLMSRDSDGFSRWDASQKLGVSVIEDIMASFRNDKPLDVDPRLIEAYRLVLADASLDKAMVALMLQLPSEAYLSELAELIDVEAIHFARQHVRKAIALALKEEFLVVYKQNQDEQPYQPDAASVAQRALKNRALGYLMLSPDETVVDLCQQQFSGANNMTDVFSALSLLTHSDADLVNTLKQSALDSFYQKWQHEALVINQWLSVQATSPVPGTLGNVKQLMEHVAFDLKNPNKVRSLIGAFSNVNAINFHVSDGEGYQFLTDQIIQLNSLNPQIAARLVTPLSKWRKYDGGRQSLMKENLERILAETELSKDVYEVVSKSIKV